MDESVKHKLNHSYVWLGALRIVPFVFVVAIASAGDALFELIDIYATAVLSSSYCWY